MNRASYHCSPIAVLHAIIIKVITLLLDDGVTFDVFNSRKNL